MRPKTLLAAAALVAAAALPSSAHAAAPAAQLAKLRSGTVILQAQPGQLATLRSRLTGLGTEPAVFKHLDMVAVRGSATLLTSAAKLSAVRYAHMDRRIRLLDDKSTPLVYGGGRQQA